MAVVSVITLTLLGCSPSIPSENDGRTKFERLVRQKLISTFGRSGQNIPFKVTKFKKLNGVSGKMMGVKVYRMDYYAEVIFPEGVHPECAVDKPPIKCLMIGMGAGAPIMAAYSDVLGKVILIRKKGSRLSGKGILTWEKTENGWR